MRLGFQEFAPLERPGLAEPHLTKRGRCVIEALVFATLVESTTMQIFISPVSPPRHPRAARARRLRLALGLALAGTCSVALAAPPTGGPPQAAQPQSAPPQLPLTPPGAQPAPDSVRPSMPPITVPPVRTHLGTAQPGIDVPSPTAEQVPSLVRVVALANERGPRVLLGRAYVGTARAGYAGARLAPLSNPYLELTADRFVGTGSNNRDPNLLAQLWLPVELFGQRGKRIEETDAAVRVSERSLDLSRAIATGEAVRAYGAVVVGAARLKVLGDLMEVSRSEAKSYEERYSAGDATIQDANLARVDLARYAVLLEEAKGDTAAAFVELNRLTASSFELPPDSPLRPPPVTQRPNADDLPAVQTPRAEADYHARVKDRYKREALGPISLIVTGGRDEIGDAKLGGGLGYTFPIIRRNQGEQARADAERSRALVESQINKNLVESRLTALGIELTQVRSALDMLRDQAEPAAVAAVESATAMRRAGKGELLAVLTSRRDLALVQLRRLELATREWNLLGELTSITGKIQ